MTAAAATYRRPELRLAPTPNAESREFWSGGQRGELMICRCHQCGRFFHPPGPVCWRCRSFDVAPEPVSGRATVAAFTINRQPWIPGFEPPYVVAMVELAEERDVRLVSNVVDIAVEDVRIGLEVEVFFEDWTALSSGQERSDPEIDGGDEDTRVWLPLFRPVAG